MRALLIVLTFAWAGCVYAQADAFERVLIPVSAARMPGAFGSSWSTELMGRNTSGAPVAVFPLAVSDGFLVHDLTTRIPIGVRPAAAPGHFLFFSRTGTPRAVYLDLRLFNEADPRSSWGTKLPVVRDDAFRAGVLHLINVPTADAFRTALRIYGLPESGPGGTVTITYLGSRDQILATDILPFTGGFNEYSPLYAQVFGISERLHDGAGGEPVTITVESSDAAARLWAFVTVTANETQHVSIVTPD
jgi:hypothetical protein